jgi:hypothetical protein
LDEDSSILFNSLHIHLEGKIVHFPIPPDLLAGLQPSAAFSEPEPGRNGGIDKSLKYFRDRFANEYLGFGNRRMFHSHDKHSVIHPRAEGDERTPIQTKRGESVADALLRLGRDGADGLAEFLERGSLIGIHAREIFVNRLGFALRLGHKR